MQQKHAVILVKSNRQPRNVEAIQQPKTHVWVLSIFGHKQVQHLRRGREERAEHDDYSTITSCEFSHSVSSGPGFFPEVREWCELRSTTNFIITNSIMWWTFVGLPASYHHLFQFAATTLGFGVLVAYQIHLQGERSSHRRTLRRYYGLKPSIARQHSAGRVPPHRTARHLFSVRARLRVWLFDSHTTPPPTTASASCPLLGGMPNASVATKRQREIRLLTETLSALSQRVEALANNSTQQKQRKSRGRNNRPPRPRRQPEPTPSAPGCNSGHLSLWEMLCHHVENARSRGTVPTDQEILRAFGQFTTDKGHVHTKRSTQVSSPTQRDQHHDNPTPPRPITTWSERLTKGAAPHPSVSKTIARLWSHNWDCTTVSASSFADHKLDTPAVVCCNSQEELDDAQSYLKARGKPVSVTFVLVGAGEDHVMVTTGANPKRVPATIIYDGEHAPRQRSLPSSITDDTPTEETPNKPATMLIRLTIAADFADENIFQPTAKNPLLLPSTILSPTLAKGVIQTRGPISTKTYSTCLVLVRENTGNEILQLQPPLGVFIARHRDPAANRPQWIPRKTDVPTGTYFTTVSATAKAQGGRMIFRESPNSPLGILCTNTIADAQSPQWVIKHVDKDWHEEDLTTFVRPADTPTHASGTAVPQQLGSSEQQHQRESLVEIRFSHSSQGSPSNLPCTPNVRLRSLKCVANHNGALPRRPGPPTLRLRRQRPTPLRLTTKAML